MITFYNTATRKLGGGFFIYKKTPACFHAGFESEPINSLFFKLLPSEFDFVAYEYETEKDENADDAMGIKVIYEIDRCPEFLFCRLLVRDESCRVRAFCNRRIIRLKLPRLEAEV